MCRLIKLAEHIFLNSQYNLLATHLAHFRLTFGQRNWGWWAASTRILSVRGASSLIISVIMLSSIKKCNLLTRWISLPDDLLVQLITNNSSKGKITPRNLVLFDTLFFLFIIALQIIRLLVKIIWRMIDFLKYTDEDYLCSKVLDFMMTKRVHKWIKNRVYFFTETRSDFLKYKI